MSAHKRFKPIKITLIHNPSAGDDAQPSADQIVKLIRGAGHKINYQSSKEKNWKKALKKSCDIIAVAGGDGTVGKVARWLAGSRTPIAILPVGTANNLARSLGLAGKTLEYLIDNWESGRRINFDIGRARGPWGSENFIEGFGVGLFAATIARAAGVHNINPAISREDKIKTVLRILKDRLRKHRPKRLKVRLDDQDLSGEYLMLEALNIRYVGPKLDLVPSADTNDGLLDIVLLPCDQEAVLRKYLTDCIAQKNVKANLPVVRGRHLEIEWHGFPVHIDDRSWPKEKEQTGAKAIDISVGSHALVFIAPKKTKQQLKPVSGSASMSA